MKLKEAVKIAKSRGFDAVAVCDDGIICGFTPAPKLNAGEWWIPITGKRGIIGFYTGYKEQQDTLRIIK